MAGRLEFTPMAIRVLNIVHTGGSTPLTPTGLVEAGSTSTSITVDWNDNPELGVSYNMYLDDVFNQNVSSSTGTFVGLSPSTSYTLEVTAVVEGRESARISITESTDAGGAEPYDLGNVPFTYAWPTFPQGTLTDTTTSDLGTINGLTSGVQQKIILNGNVSGTITISGTDIELDLNGNTVDAVSVNGAVRVKVYDGRIESTTNPLLHLRSGNDIFFENVFINEPNVGEEAGDAIRYGAVPGGNTLTSRTAFVGCTASCLAPEGGGWALHGRADSGHENTIFANCLFENRNDDDGQCVRHIGARKAIFRDCAITGGSNTFRSGPADSATPNSQSDEWRVSRSIIVGNPQLTGFSRDLPAGVHTDISIDQLELYRPSGAPQAFNGGTDQVTGTVSNSRLIGPGVSTINYGNYTNGTGNTPVNAGGDEADVDWTQNGALPAKTSKTNYGSTF